MVPVPDICCSGHAKAVLSFQGVLVDHPDGQHSIVQVELASKSASDIHLLSTSVMMVLLCCILSEKYIMCMSLGNMQHRQIQMHLLWGKSSTRDFQAAFQAALRGGRGQTQQCQKWLSRSRNCS